MRGVEKTRPQKSTAAVFTESGALFRKKQAFHSRGVEKTRPQQSTAAVFIESGALFKKKQAFKSRGVEKTRLQQSTAAVFTESGALFRKNKRFSREGSKKRGFSCEKCREIRGSLWSETSGLEFADFQRIRAVQKSGDDDDDDDDDDDSDDDDDDDDHDDHDDHDDRDDDDYDDDDESVVTYVLTQQGAYQSCYITAFGSGVVVYSYHDKHNVYDKWQSRKPLRYSIVCHYRPQFLLARPDTGSCSVG